MVDIRIFVFNHEKFSHDISGFSVRRLEDMHYEIWKYIMLNDNCIKNKQPYLEKGKDRFSMHYIRDAITRHILYSYRLEKDKSNMNYPKGKINLDESENMIVLNEKDIITPKDRVSFAARTIGNFKGKGYYLKSIYNWQILEDDAGCLILVCTRK